MTYTSQSAAGFQATCCCRGQQSLAEAKQQSGPELSRAPAPLLTTLTTSWEPHLAVSTRGLYIWPK